MKKNIVFGVIGIIVGGITSYLYCRKRFDESDYNIDEIVDKEEIDTVEEIKVYGHEVLIPAPKTNLVFSDKKEPHETFRSYNKIVNKLYIDETKPMVITESQFNDECEIHDKITVLYYVNGVITDEYNELMDDIDKVIGINNLSLFGYGSSDKDVLYVRNNMLKIDYEILKQHTEYQTDI